MRRHGADTSDEELLAAFRTGRQEAFTLLFRRWSRPVFGHVLGLVKDRDLADDVTQRVFLKLARRPGAYTPGTSFSSWLHRVARNEALDELKKLRRRRVEREADPSSRTSSRRGRSCEYGWHRSWRRIRRHGPHPLDRTPQPSPGR
jgi:RNA polymerase sigma factor (sigma-70 family)